MNNIKISETSEILRHCRENLKRKKSFRLKNKSKAYFYGNFYSTLEKGKITLLTILKG